MVIALTMSPPAFSQNNALILNGAFVKINGGTWANPVYLVVNGGQPAAIQRNSGHIISESEGNYVLWNTADITVNSDYIIPFGFSTSAYLPLTFHKTSVGVGLGHINNASALTTSTWGTASDNLAWANSVTNMTGPLGGNEFNTTIDRWWQVKSGSNVSATFDVTYRGSENTTTVSPTGTFSGQHWDIATSQWLAPTGSGTGVTTGTGSVTGITFVPHGTSSSSPYVLTSAASPLPIELVSFTALCENGKIHINWKTATETNVHDIQLQKSTDLSNWTTIYTAIPTNTSSLTNYDFEYNESATTTIYYRLVNNDNDGQSDISNIIYIQPCDSEENTLTAFYFNSNLNIHTIFSVGANVQFELYDLQGKKVQAGEYIATEGDQLVAIPLEQLSNSIYIFRAESTGKIYNQKLLISTQ